MDNTTNLTWYLLHQEPQIFAQNELYHAKIANQNICFGKNNKGFFASLDKCPHLGIKLSKGTLSFDGDIVCALHQYCYDTITGKETKSRKTADLIIFDTELRNDGLYIAIPEKKEEKKDEFSY
jgi:nitrite reductase/ring-hydroxylating ferredoxin subunit